MVIRVVGSHPLFWFTSFQVFRRRIGGIGTFSGELHGAPIDFDLTVGSSPDDDKP
jgi:hypothetical protein